MARKKWTTEEKLQIIKEAEESSTELTIRKHGIYPSTFYSWRKKYRIGGDAGLRRIERVTKDDNYIRRLEDELSLAKQLIADRDMELALKDELLKKKYPWARKKI
jgi:putative transposase